MRLRHTTARALWAASAGLIWISLPALSLYAIVTDHRVLVGEPRAFNLRLTYQFGEAQ